MKDLAELKRINKKKGVGKKLGKDNGKELPKRPLKYRKKRR